MPTYDYRCDRCGPFDAVRRIADREQPLPCPNCGADSPRTWLAAARVSDMDTGLRLAMETNERARHEPQRSSDYARLKHPSGCGCCSGARRSATVTGGNGNKAFPSKRPWMISH
ncbi:zinc ribbon domain-containing protein [Aquincola sp. MAHUQ-54]|uniref:Zinc ribbon domain-containing protein n=1 Tax=Aquincola agrisoli TaxID=3119538 RepID=A0AAW9QJA8_9BURK